MTDVLEDEAKFSFPEGAELPSFDSGKRVAAAAKPYVLTSVYYDTPDLRLAAAGITLRRRTRSGRPVSWDLKVPALPGQIGVRREIGLADRSTQPPAAHLDVLAGWLGGDALGVVATLKTRRTAWTVDGAEIVDDEVEGRNGTAEPVRFREVEVESHGAPGSYLRTVAKRLEKAGGTPVAVTKLARVVPVPAVVRMPSVSKRAPVSALLVRGLRTAGDDFLAADVGVRLGDEDAIHQLRVASRRMRSLLRAYGDVLEDDWRAHLDGELRWVGQSLGAARDAEVIAARLDRDAGTAPADDAIRADVVARRESAAAAAKATLLEPRYLDLARHVRTQFVAPPLKSKGDPAGAVADRVVAKAWRDLERSVRALRSHHEDAAWHDVRIRAKRARYAAETAAVVNPAARRIARNAEAVQDVLGDWHDAVMAVETLLECAAARPGDGAYGFAAGQLAERERRAAERTQASLAGVWRKRRR